MKSVVQMSSGLLYIISFLFVSITTSIYFWRYDEKGKLYGLSPLIAIVLIDIAGYIMVFFAMLSQTDMTNPLEVVALVVAPFSVFIISLSIALGVMGRSVETRNFWKDILKELDDEK